MRVSRTPAQPVRVTHVVHEFEGGGLETLVASMARAMDPSRVSTSVVSLSGSPGRLGRELDGVLRRMVAVRSLPLLSMIAPLAIVRSLRQTEAEVVHIHSGVWFKAALAARLAGVGAIYTEHGREHDDPPMNRWMDRRAARMTTRLVAVSGRLETYLRETVGIHHALLTTIENGIDTDRFSPGPPAALTRESLGIPANAIVVGSVGRLETVKAYERLLRSVRMVLDRSGERTDAPIFVLLCGDGSQRGALTALAESLGLRQNVVLPGWLADPADAYRVMDVFVLPSISEGLSVSLLEAMATGLTPLVTPVGSNREVLGDALSSQVVSAEDLGEFAAALGRVTSSPSLRRELSVAARQAVVTRFSQTRMVEAYTRLYEDMAGRPQPAA